MEAPLKSEGSKNFKFIIDDSSFMARALNYSKLKKVSLLELYSEFDDLRHKNNDSVKNEHCGVAK